MFQSEKNLKWCNIMESLKEMSSAIFFSNNEFIQTLMQIMSLCCRAPLLTKIYQGHSETHCCTDVPHTPCCCLKLSLASELPRGIKNVRFAHVFAFISPRHKIMDMFKSQTFNPLEENHWQCRQVGMHRAKD